MGIPKFTKPDPATLALFLGTWLAVGFTLGTLTLLGPVRWITSAMRDAGASDLAERATVLAVIATYVAVSFVGSVALTRAVSGGALWRRLAIPVGAWAMAVACLWLWMTPALVNGFQPVEIDTVARFTFGPYPERDRFEQLRADGFTAVVSLLHPAVVPFEPSLLARERELAEEFGIELIHAPMLPWIGDNADTIAQLKELAKQTSGRYYIHCYLGRDRVGVVRGLIERHGDAAVADVRAAPPTDVDFNRSDFERGPVTEIDDAVFLAPFPTDEEMFQYVLSGTFASVVSLLDPNNPNDVQWIDKERDLLEEHGIAFSLQPVPWMKYSPESARMAADHVRSLPRPVLVHAFRSTGSTAEAFTLAYRTGLPTVAPSSFDEPMLGGQARVVAPNVVLGPRPAGPEFGTYLRARGIRGVVFVGDGSREDAANDRVVAEREADLEFRAVPAEVGRVAALVAVDGPWYVYGPGVGQVQQGLVTRFARSLAAPESAAAAAAGR
jgi:protein tyrosine phosphatase (PTP) superfamily phosphohydrolase (DUF442 family)